MNRPFSDRNISLSFSFFCFLGFLLLLPLQYTQASEKPYSTNQPIQILASVKPLTLLVQSVVGDLAKVDTLIPESFDVHGYTLKVSDLKRLYDSDVVFYIHPELEGNINKASQSSSRTKFLWLFNPTLAQSVLTNTALNSNLSPYLKEQLNELIESSTESHEVHDKAKKEDHQATDGHGHGHGHHEGLDVHIWLDPNFALVMLDAIASDLSTLYPEHEAQFKGNAELSKSQIKRSEVLVKAKLSQVQSEPFLVFHDAYRYFVSHFQLNQVDFISDEHANVSAAKISHLREDLNNYQIRCIFSQSQFTRANRIISTIKGSHSLKVKNLDPMATSQSSYADFLVNLSSDMDECLNPLTNEFIQ